jgi:2-polyprenyl-3-methyl-5-hydroxy-6-metoxy-1,4-benzoquinol methylase
MLQTERNYQDYWASLTVSHSSHPANRFRYELIAEELQRLSLQPRRILDCGCGDGSLLSVLTAHLRCREVHGIDVADNVPLHRSGVAVQFHHHDLGKPVPAELYGQYDLVLCSEVIEHVSTDGVLIQNLTRLAKPGGWIVLSTQSGRIYRTEQFLGHLRHYKREELGARLEQEGVKIEKSYVCGWPWLNLQKIAAHVFQGTVQKNIVQATRLSTPVRMVFFVLYHLYTRASRSRGPQIVILARKPE